MEENKTMEEIARDPLSIRVQAAKQELSSLILNVQGKYCFPSYLMDLLVSSVLSDVREVELKVLLNDLTPEQSKKKEG